MPQGPGVPYSQLDANAIFQRVFDEINDRLRVDAAVTVTLGTVEVIITDVNDSIKIGDGSGLNFATVTTVGPKKGLDVNLIGGVLSLVDSTTGDPLAINPNGSINVVLQASGAPTINKNIYNEVTSIANSVSTSIVTYTVPVSKTADLKRVNVSGTNVAEYSVLVNATRIDKKRTYFGGGLNEVFDFSSFNDNGYGLIAGDQVIVKVIHSRPSLGDFNAGIQVVEIG